ncbi:MAG: glycosyltransferase family 39 protein [Candidatus Hinthialibacter antarcticus]|nr:glycosyltransferase family 39 protein [Candidatus Hinthialibacter antarcticus]
MKRPNSIWSLLAGLTVMLLLQSCSMPNEIDPKFSMDNEVLVFTADGAFLRKSPPLRGAPMDIEWLPDGRAAIAADNAGITIFDPETGKTGKYIGHNRITEFDVIDGREALGVHPYYITASYFEQVVRLLDQDGRTLKEIPAPQGVHDVDLLPNGNLLRVDARENVVVEVTLSGEEVWRSTVPLLNPYEAILTERDTIVIANFDRHRVVEIDRDNNVLKEIEGFNHPRRIQRVAEGYYVIADSDMKRVMALTPDGQTFSMADGLNRPLSVAYDPLKQRLLVGAQNFFDPPEEVKLSTLGRWQGYGMTFAIWLVPSLLLIFGFALWRRFRDPLGGAGAAAHGWAVRILAEYSHWPLSLGLLMCIGAALLFAYHFAVLGFSFLVIGLPLVWLSRCRREWWFDALPATIEDENLEDEDKKTGVIRWPWLMIAGLLLSWMAFVWSQYWGASLWPVAPWLIGPLLCVLAVRKEYQAAFRPANIAWGAAILALALFFRAYRIDEIPYGLWLDEVYSLWNALLSFENHTLRPFETMPLVRVNEFEITQLYLLIIGGVAKYLSLSYLTVKWFSILPGLGIVLATYCLGKWSYGAWVGRLAALVVAVNSWQVTFARWGWLQQVYVMCALFALAYFIRAYRYKCARSAALSGLWLGYGFFTYLPIVITTATIALLWCISFFEEDRRLRVKQCVLSALLCMIVFAPLFAHYRAHPGVFMVRAQSAGITKDVFQADSWDPLKENIRRYVVALHWEGDRIGRHNVPGKPMLDPITGGLLFAGLLLTAYRFYRPGERMLLIAMGAAMAGGILSMSVEAPNTFRLGVVGPIVCLWAALPLASLLHRREQQNQDDDKARLWVPVLVVVLLAGMIGLNYYRYFVQYPDNRNWPVTYGEEQHLAYQHLTKDDVGRDRLIVHPKYSNRTFNIYMLFLEAQNKSLREAKLKESTRYMAKDIKQGLPSEPTRPATFLMPADYEEFLREKFPDIEIEKLDTPFGDPNAIIGRLK